MSGSCVSSLRTYLRGSQKANGFIIDSLSFFVFLFVDACGLLAFLCRTCLLIYMYDAMSLKIVYSAYWIAILV